MNKWDNAYDEKADMPIRIINDYDLVELSLVDNPANQFASILSVEKVDGVDVVTGFDSTTVLENVFWDKDSGLVMLSESDVAVSPTSGEPLQNIGFVEKSDAEKIDMIKFLVDSAKNTSAKINKEVSPMTTTETATDAVVETVEVAPEADAVVETTEDTIDTADADVSVEKVDEIVTKAKTVDSPEEEATEEVDNLEEEANEDMKTKKSNEVVDAINEINESVTKAFGDFAETLKALSAEVSALKKSNEVTSAQLEDAENDFNNLGKRIDALDADTAFRKSGDLGEIVQEPAMVKTSVWGGRFLTNSDLLK